MTTREDLKPIRSRRSVQEAMKDWKIRQQAASDNGTERTAYPPAESILRSLPRRQQSVPPDERKLWIPYVEQLPIRNTFWKSVRRLFTWMGLILFIVVGNFLDQ